MKAALALCAAVALSSCATTPDPCAGAGTACLALTVTSATVTAVDTLTLTASGAFSGTHQSSTGHSSPLPIRLRVTYPASTSGTVHLAVVAQLGGGIVGHGSGDVTIKPGTQSSLSVNLVGGTVATNGDMAIPPNSDLSGSGPTDMAAMPGADLNVPGADMYRETLSFSAKGPFNIGPNPIAVALGNFQGKGNVDIIAASDDGTSPGAYLLLQTAAGSWPASPTSFASGFPARGIGVGRWFTGATKQDFVFSDGRFNLIVGDNNGAAPPVFTTSMYPSNFEIGMTPSAIAVGDFNKDNADDVAFSVASDGTAAAIGIALCAGNGSLMAGATMAPPPVYYHPGEAVSQLAAGDFGNGKIDIVGTMGTTDLIILHNDGTGTFTFSATSDKHTVGSNPAFIAIADFDGNGKNDIAVANNGGSVSILLNDGTGGFPAAATSVSAGTMPNGIAAADFDGDGNVDLAVTNSNSQISVLLGDGHGHFAAPAPVTVGSAPSSVAAADLNADVKPDLVVTNQADGTVTVLINTSH